MADLGSVTINVDLEPSDKVKELIAAEVEKQLAGRFLDLLKEIESRVEPQALERIVAEEWSKNIRETTGQRTEIVPCADLGRQR